MGSLLLVDSFVSFLLHNLWLSIHSVMCQTVLPFKLQYIVARCVIELIVSS